jgi:hypothetical protein
MTRLEYFPMENMLADRFTNALGPGGHRKLAKMMGMGMWQKSEDYAIKETNKKMEKKQEGNCKTLSATAARSPD